MSTACWCTDTKSLHSCVFTSVVQSMVKCSSHSVATSMNASVGQL